MNSSSMKPLVLFAIPGLYLVYRYNQYRQEKQRSKADRRKITEKELLTLNNKIEKLLQKLERYDVEKSTTDDDECVVCISAKATMHTYPCGHKVVCRKCFVKTIQVAVTQKMLPLRCVICRSRILKLKQSVGLPVL
ncbi:uncharacterized protein LOC100374953 [Saccoglossus kowalevskii]|uniref:Uncharacterized protein LOC100374953 n=1 Tax=Saccoglossus kowalevskii TaxID=10224 RepID=A0ABM0MVR3_SACKO|nr:PREDICTED: uncharacterized protein LOC100374953 [Saccoglossus kowalevskii]